MPPHLTPALHDLRALWGVSENSGMGVRNQSEWVSENLRRRHLASVLRTVAREDPLTGLANRRSWDERLDAELERAKRSGEAVSVVVADLDGFKAVNDAHGHHAGDRLLQATASSWRAATRGGGDFLARLGGDEFGLLLSGADEVGARGLARRLTEALPAGLSASVGVVTWDRVEGASDLVRRADRAMYHAKRRRRRDGGPRPA